MISIIDYGLGNLMAFANIYKKLNIPTKIVSKSIDLVDAEKIILPGVGSFDWAMKKLENSGMIEAINNSVIEKKVPILGICVGMQMMTKSSEEGKLPGLGWIDAQVKKFDDHEGLPLPHMGWNSISFVKDDLLFNNIKNNEYFYFCHSYYFDCQNKDNILAKTNYGQYFSSVVKNENIYGIQFHPEKSHDWGVKILDNFAKL